MRKPYIVGAIFARGGSKGVPRKNIRPLAGKPLIAYAIEAARGAAAIDRVIVSTDDDEIASIARRYGAEVPFLRPAALAGDRSPEWLAWQHALRTLETQDGRCPDVLVCVPTTSPMRSAADVAAAVDALVNSTADVVITVTPAARNPYFNMVELEAGCARLVKTLPGGVQQRQAAPPVYDITTVAYAARADFVLKASSLFDGKVGAVVVPVERALDIDTEQDFAFAEFLLQRAA